MSAPEKSPAWSPNYLVALLILGLIVTGVGIIVVVTQWPRLEVPDGSGLLDAGTVTQTGNVAAAVVGAIVMEIGSSALLVALIGIGVKLGRGSTARP